MEDEKMKVLVVGSTSGCGLQVTKLLLEQLGKYEIYALVRNRERAIEAIGEGSENVNFVSGDVTKKETLADACKNKDAVLCTVGARVGWRIPGFNQNTPRFVDYLGVKNLAEAAAAAHVSKFVLVSSMAVTRPFSSVGLFLNTLIGRVLSWKLKGEECLRSVYSSDKELSYYIIRPGGLNNNKGGVHRVVVEQGDTGSGSIAREDVAHVVVACLQGISPPNVTFEIYNDKSSSMVDLTNVLSTLKSDQQK